MVGDKILHSFDAGNFQNIVPRRKIQKKISRFKTGCFSRRVFLNFNNHHALFRQSSAGRIVLCSTLIGTPTKYVADKNGQAKNKLNKTPAARIKART